jgi:hypothetical protein
MSCTAYAVSCPGNTIPRGFTGLAGAISTGVSTFVSTCLYGRKLKVKADFKAVYHITIKRGTQALSTRV